MPSETSVSLTRIAAPFHGVRQSLELWQSQRGQVEAFRRAGRELASNPSAADDDRFQPFFAALGRHQARMDVLTEVLAKSRDRERADREAVVFLLRPLVMLRGLCNRALLHYRMQRYRRETVLCHEALGRAARRYSAEEMEMGESAPVVRAPRRRRRKAS